MRQLLAGRAVIVWNGAMDARRIENIDTARLRLRPWRVEEAAIQRALWQERDPRVPARRRIGADGRPSLADLEEHIRTDARSTAYGLPALERKAEGDVIGYCGLVEGGPGAHALDAARPGPEIAFELLRSAQGQGYATEAARAVVAWAREAGIPLLHATVWAWNAPSLRVLDRLGFAAAKPGRADPELLVRSLDLRP